MPSWRADAKSKEEERMETRSCSTFFISYEPFSRGRILLGNLTSGERERVSRVSIEAICWRLRVFERSFLYDLSPRILNHER